MMKKKKRKLCYYITKYYNNTNTDLKKRKYSKKSIQLFTEYRTTIFCNKNLFFCVFVFFQVKQKMKENGMTMENITVNWRVQSDGNIFNKEKKDGL